PPTIHSYFSSHATAPTATYPLSLHDALPIYIGNRCAAARINYELAPLRTELKNGDRVEIITAAHEHPNPAWLISTRSPFLSSVRSEEHTSELQSRSDLVCRLLLEKKKK